MAAVERAAGVVVDGVEVLVFEVVGVGPGIDHDALGLPGGAAVGRDGVDHGVVVVGAVVAQHHVVEDDLAVVVPLRPPGRSRRRCRRRFRRSRGRRRCRGAGRCSPRCRHRRSRRRRPGCRHRRCRSGVPGVGRGDHLARVGRVDPDLDLALVLVGRQRVVVGGVPVGADRGGRGDRSGRTGLRRLEGELVDRLADVVERLGQVRVEVQPAHVPLPDELRHLELVAALLHVDLEHGERRDRQELEVAVDHRAVAQVAAQTLLESDELGVGLEGLVDRDELVEVRGDRPLGGGRGRRGERDGEGEGEAEARDGDASHSFSLLALA